MAKPEDFIDNPVAPDSGFYRRWSEKKQASRQPLAEQDDPPEAAFQPGDEDMPPLESLDENSDYSGFLSPKVSDPLRKLALRKLFHSAGFNVCDGLDDYDEDFTRFEKLGDVMTADLRHRLEREARKQQQEEQDQAVAENRGPDRDDNAGAGEADEEQGAPGTAQREDSTDEAER